MRSFILAMVALFVWGIGPVSASAASHNKTAAQNAQAQAAFDRGDYAQARKIWEKLAKKKDPVALNSLGEIYKFRKGVGIDPAKAFALFKQASEQPARPMGKIDSNLAQSYYYGFGTSKNKPLAFKFMQQAVDANEPDAAFWLGTWYRSSDDLPDRKLALENYRKGAALGSAESAFEAGRMLYFGDGAEENIPEAREYMIFAAEKDFIRAAGFLGDRAAEAYSVDGTPEQKAEAEKWYRAGLAMGDPTFQDNLNDLDKIIPGEAARQAAQEAARAARAAAQAAAESASLNKAYALARAGQHSAAYQAFAADCQRGYGLGCYEQGVYLVRGEYVAQDVLAAVTLFDTACAKLNTRDSCDNFAKAVYLAEGRASRSQNERALYVFKMLCGLTKGPTEMCYPAAHMTWDDQYGLRDKKDSDTYSLVACNRNPSNTQACQMARYWGAIAYNNFQNAKAYYQSQERAKQRSKPSFLNGLAAAFVMGANQIDTSSTRPNAASAYGEIQRARESERHKYYMSTTRSGSVNYGACINVNTPNC